jgi:hypothetical protein
VSQKSPRVKLAFADSGYAGDETQRPAYEASRIRPKRRFPSRCAITPDPLPIKKVASPAPPLPRERSTNPLEFHPCHAERSAGRERFAWRRRRRIHGHRPCREAPQPLTCRRRYGRRVRRHRSGPILCHVLLSTWADTWSEGRNPSPCTFRQASRRPGRLASSVGTVRAQCSVASGQRVCSAHPGG